MSEKNVDVVRGVFDAWKRGDLAEVIRPFDQHAVIRPIIGPEWHGPEGVLGMASDWLEGFEDFVMTAEDLTDTGDVVVVRVRQEAREASTRVPVEATFWFTFSIRDGKVVRFEMFQRREEALDAMGLRE
jgi:ketosteroid isomerase-like protein